MVEKKKRAIVDTWKIKEWYDVIAPEMFESRELGQVAASDPKTLINRIVEIPMSEITGNRSQIFTKLMFRVISVEGKTVKTKLIGHKLSKDYIRTLVRRGKSFVDFVGNHTTKDNQEVVLKTRIFVGAKIGDDKKSALRTILFAECEKKIKTLDYIAMEQEILAGNISRELFNSLKMVIPIAKIEIKKVELKETFAS
jgi:small subunit ribosomal protein S3Ae